MKLNHKKLLPKVIYDKLAKDKNESNYDIKGCYLDSQLVYSKILNNNDLITILGQPGTGKKELINKLINVTTYKNGKNIVQSQLNMRNTACIKAYKEKLKKNKGLSTELLELLEQKKYFKDFIFSKSSTIECLNQLIEKYIKYFEDNFLETIILLIDDINKKEPINRAKEDILKGLYKLTANRKNLEKKQGLDFVLIVKKLKEYDRQNPSVKRLLAAKKFDSTKTMENLKDVIISFKEPQNIYIDGTIRKRVLNIFDKLAGYINTATDKAKIEIDTTLDSYINNMPPDIIDYLVPFDINYPILVGELLIIHLDYLDKSTLEAVLPKAKKMVVFSTIETEEFKFYQNIANELWSIDKINRVFTISHNYLYNQDIAEFMSNNFYENYPITSDKNFTTQSFAWLRKSDILEKNDFILHINDMILKNNKIAIIAKDDNEIIKILKNANIVGDITIIEADMAKYHLGKYQVVYIFGTQPLDIFCIGVATDTIAVVSDQGALSDKIFRNIYLKGNVE